MGRRLDPTIKVKRGPGRKARKQKGAETELSKFLVDGKSYINILGVICLLAFVLLFINSLLIYIHNRYYNVSYNL